MQFCCGLLFEDEPAVPELLFPEDVFPLLELDVPLFFEELPVLFLLPDVELFLPDSELLLVEPLEEDLSYLFALTLTVNSFVASLPALSAAVTFTLYSPAFEVSNFEESIR